MIGIPRAWLPAVVVPGAVIALGLGLASRAGASVDLPDKSAEEVLAMLVGSQVSQLSGTVEQTSDLGLPGLPVAGGQGLSELAGAVELLTSDHTARVYVDGPTRMRVQVLDPLAERDLVRNGRDVWLYSSTDNRVKHTTLPEQSGTEARVPAEAPTPQQLAAWALAGIEPSTEVDVGRDGRVAGRDAYELILRPRSDVPTLVESVSIAVDAQTGMALAGSIRARGQQQDALRVAFTDLELAAPDPRRFQLEPPQGASVEQLAPVDHDEQWAAGPAGSSGGPKVDGQGWAAVVQLAATGAPPEPAAAALLAAVTSPVDGGRVLGTSLVNVLFTDDGRVLAGAVPVQRLLDVAATG